MKNSITAIVRTKSITGDVKIFSHVSGFELITICGREYYLQSIETEPFFGMMLFEFWDNSGVYGSGCYSDFDDEYYIEIGGEKQ